MVRAVGGTDDAVMSPRSRVVVTVVAGVIGIAIAVVPAYIALILFICWAFEQDCAPGEPLLIPLLAAMTPAIPVFTVWLSTKIGRGHGPTPF